MSLHDSYFMGREVLRNGSPNSYTTGRRGVILDCNFSDPSRCRVRVRWTHERNGEIIGKSLRTWVRVHDLKPI